MSNIASFFNKGTFSVENLVTDPVVIKDESFVYNFYVYDIIKSTTAKTISVTMFVADGRDEVLITNVPTVYLVDANTWQLSAIIPSGEWDGKKPILLKFLIEDLLDVMHEVETYLIKD